MRPFIHLAAALAALSAACAQPNTSSPPIASSEPSAPSGAPATAIPASADAAVLRRVASDEVCMMNNRFMKEKQIPVEIEGRTYFGCCAMCKDKLTNDPATRTATDPVSGRPVDKAMAVIGAKPSNAVVYFENQQNFDAYVRAGGPPPRDAAAAAPASGSAQSGAAADTKAATPAPPAKSAAPPPAAPRPAAPPPAAPRPAAAPPAAPAPTGAAAGQGDHAGHQGH